MRVAVTSARCAATIFRTVGARYVAKRSSSRRGSNRRPATSPRCASRTNASFTQWSRNASNASKYPSTFSKPHGWACSPSCAHVRIFERFFERAEAARQRDEAVGQFRHRRFALVHRFDDAKVGESAMPHLTLHQRVRNDAGHATAARERRVGEHAHQPDATAAVHEFDIALRPAPLRVPPRPCDTCHSRPGSNRQTRRCASRADHHDAKTSQRRIRRARRARMRQPLRADRCGAARRCSR